jgi:SAM-dependent methyltransferase
MLQLGASDKSLMGWLNSDLDPVCFKDIFLDATKRFPLPNSTIDFVFSEHFFEHIDRLEGEHCAKEVYRCLKPGGVMRLATPNLQRYIGLFRSDLDPSEADHLNRFKDKFRLSSISPCLALNHLMYNWGHRFLYNESELIAMLKAAGFQTIKSVAVGKSSYPQLSDLEQHWKFYGKEMNDFETMVFEATK